MQKLVMVMVQYKMREAGVYSMQLQAERSKTEHRACMSYVLVLQLNLCIAGYRSRMIPDDLLIFRCMFVFFGGA